MSGRKVSYAAPASLLGASLVTLHEQTTRRIPLILEECCGWLRTKAMKEPGLFRTSGNTDKCTELLKAFETNNFRGVDKIPGCGPHEVAALVKLFLRTLTDPLIPANLVPEFIKLELDPPPIDAVRTLMDQMPKSHSETFVWFLSFLRELSANSIDNGLSLNTLAVTFAPLIMRAPSILDPSAGIPVLQMLLVNYVDFWPPASTTSSAPPSLKKMRSSHGLLTASGIVKKNLQLTLEQGDSHDVEDSGDASETGAKLTKANTARLQNGSTRSPLKQLFEPPPGAAATASPVPGAPSSAPRRLSDKGWEFEEDATPETEEMREAKLEAIRQMLLVDPRIQSRSVGGGAPATYEPVVKKKTRRKAAGKKHSSSGNSIDTAGAAYNQAPAIPAEPPVVVAAVAAEPVVETIMSAPPEQPRRRGSIVNELEPKDFPQMPGELSMPAPTAAPPPPDKSPRPGGGGRRKTVAVPRTSCGKCGLLVKGQKVSAMGKIFHRQCFCCATCDAVLESFFECAGQAYCPDHIAAAELKEDLAHGNTCGKCNLPTDSGVVVNALGRRWHENCFRCTTCNALLDNFFGAGGMPYCELHIDEAQLEVALAVPGGTVIPAPGSSGKKKKRGTAKKEKEKETPPATTIVEVVAPPKISVAGDAAICTLCKTRPVSLDCSVCGRDRCEPCGAWESRGQDFEQFICKDCIALEKSRNTTPAPAPAPASSSKATLAPPQDNPPIFVSPRQQQQQQWLP